MGSRGSFLTVLAIIACITGKMILTDQNLIRKAILLISLILAMFILYFELQSLPLFQRMTDFESYTSDVRIRLWRAGLNGFLNHPVLGSGIGAASEYSWALVGNAVHNSFIELIADQGIIGVIILGWIFLDILMTSKGNRFIIFILLIGLFLPLFFLTGYSNFTFWMPLILAKLISRNLLRHPNIDFFK